MSPPPHGITLAALPEMSLTEVIRIEAQAIVRNSRSLPIQFALVFSTARSTKVSTALGEETAYRQDVHSSGWVTASADRPAWLSCIAPITTKGRVYLATKMPPGTTNAFAWGAIRNLEITLLGISRHDQAQPTIPDTIPHALTLPSQAPRKRQLSATELVRARSTRHGPHNIICTAQHIGLYLQQDYCASAIIPSIVVENLTRVSVVVNANHVHPLEVGFAVSKDGLPIDAHTIDELANGNAQFVFSGWHALTQEGNVIIDLTIDQWLDQFITLHLLARGNRQIDPSTTGANVVLFSDFVLFDREVVNASP
jgi:hypothetical protein